MAKNELDRELLIAMPIFLIGSLTSLEILGPTIVGIDFSNILISFGNIGISLGRICSIAGLGYVYFNREIGFRDLNGYDLWIAYATAGFILAPPLFPAFAGSIAQMPAALLSMAVQTAGFTIVSVQN